MNERNAWMAMSNFWPFSCPVFFPSLPSCILASTAKLAEEFRVSTTTKGKRTHELFSKIKTGVLCNNATEKLALSRSVAHHYSRWFFFFFHSFRLILLRLNFCFRQWLFFFFCQPIRVDFFVSHFKGRCRHSVKDLCLELNQLIIFFFQFSYLLRRSRALSGVCWRFHSIYTNNINWIFWLGLSLFNRQCTR